MKQQHAFFQTKTWKVVKFGFYGYLPVALFYSYSAEASQFDRYFEGYNERYRIRLAEAEVELVNEACKKSGRSVDDLLASAFFRSRVMKVERLINNLMEGYRHPARVSENAFKFNGKVFEEKPLRGRLWKKGDKACKSYCIGKCSLTSTFMFSW